MGPQPAAIAVKDRAVGRIQSSGQKAARVTVRDEADVVAVWLLRDCQPARGRLGPHLGLRGRGPEREHRVGELLAGEHAQHV